MDLSAWVDEVRARVSDLELFGSIVDVGTDFSDQTKPLLARMGHPGVLPLWSGPYETVGVLACPLVPYREWPGIRISHGLGNGLTISATTRTLLPRVIINGRMTNNPGATRRLAERWELVRTPVTALHLALGGDPETLESVVAAAMDKDSRAKLVYRKDAALEFHDSLRALHCKVDHSSEFSRYADWLDAAIREQWKPIEAPERYGSWARRAICSAVKFAGSYAVDLKVRREWVDWLLEGPAGIDTAIAIPPSWNFQVSGSAEARLADVGRFRPRATGPARAPSAISDALAAALDEHGTDYNGLAHAEAAPTFDEAGEPVRAWNALQSAAWWAARTKGETPDIIVQGMLFLAERREWDDVIWVIRQTMKE